MGNKHSSSAASASSSSSCDSSTFSFDDSSSQRSLSAASESSGASSTRSPRPSKPFKKYVPGPSPVPEDASPAMRTAIQFVNTKNRHDIMKLYCLLDHEATFHFVDADVHMPMREFFNAMVDIFGALPDMQFNYWDIQEIQPGVIRFFDYTGAGHHKGNMSFGDNPILPPTGKLLADEPVELTLTINKDNKIARCVADAKGKLVGPPGFYIKAQRHLISSNKKEKKKTVASKSKNAAQLQ